jgi:hypothetical protein
MKTLEVFKVILVFCELHFCKPKLAANDWFLTNFMKPKQINDVIACCGKYVQMDYKIYALQ